MDMLERRSHERICVDAPVVCELVTQERGIPVMLKDISRGGLQVEIGPGKNFSAALLGQDVRVCTLPDELNMLTTGVEGVVTWISPERLGMRFHTTLLMRSDELADIIRRC